VAKEQTLIEGDFPDFIAEIETRKADSTDLAVVDGQWKRLASFSWRRGFSTRCSSRSPGSPALHGTEARQASRPAGFPPGFTDRGHSQQPAPDRALPARQVPCRSESLAAHPMDFARKHQAAP